MSKYYLIKAEEDSEIDKNISPWTNHSNVVELTPQDLQIIWYSITNTCYVFGDKLPNVVSKIRKVLE